MKKVVLFLSIAFMAGMLFANMYNSVVDVPSWGSQIPASIQTFRAYFQKSDPGDFYRLFSPLNQLLALLAVILFWRSSGAVRLFLILAFLFAVGGDVITFSFFYPRNDILLHSADSSLLRITWEQWAVMNWVRSAIVAVGNGFQFAAVSKMMR